MQTTTMQPQTTPSLDTTLTPTHKMTLISYTTESPSIISLDIGSSEETITRNGKEVQERGTEVNTRQQRSETVSVAMEDTQSSFIINNPASDYVSMSIPVVEAPIRQHYLNHQMGKWLKKFDGTKESIIDIRTREQFYPNPVLAMLSKDLLKFHRAKHQPISKHHPWKLLASGDLNGIDGYKGRRRDRFCPLEKHTAVTVSLYE
ncbi:hypothetical protein CHS0354_007288, partial [Potamilus streckersoni]